MNKIIFLILLIPSSAFGLSSRVLPVSYDEYTYNSAGGADYTSLALFEADTDIDLVAAMKGKVLTCASGVHDDSVALSGATTNASYFRVIRAASKAKGTPTSGVRFVKIITVDNYLFNIDETYDSVQDIAIKLTSTNGSMAYAFCTAANYVSFIGCTAYDGYTSGTAVGFRIAAVNPVYLINCLALNIDGNTDSAGVMVGDNSGTNQNIYIYNSTVVECNYRGVYMTSQTGYTTTTYLKNSIIQSNGTNLYTNGAGTEVWSRTTNAARGVTFAADGYHLDSTDTVAINNGTDLSADDVFAFDDDIDRGIRSDWDIGCDEFGSEAARRRIFMVQ